MKRLLLLQRFFWLVLFCPIGFQALAQRCPPGVLPPCPSPTPAACNVTVRVKDPNNRGLKDIEVRVKELPAKVFKTDRRGSDALRLPCGRDYTFTPAPQTYKFSPPTIIKRLSPGTAILDFRAEPRPTPTPKPTPTPTPTPLPCNKKEGALAELALKNPRETESWSGTLSGRSNCKSPGNYSDAYALTGALGGDLVEIGVAGTFASSLTLRVTGPDGKLLTAQTGSNPPQFIGELTQGGSYQLEVGVVSSPLQNELAYTVTVKRAGLSDGGYNAQLNRAVELLGQPGARDFFQAFGAGLRAGKKAPDEAVALLRLLAELAPKRPEAFERLGAIRLYQSENSKDADELLRIAIENGGGARFLVHHGQNLNKNKNLEKDSRLGWLAIYKGRADFVELGAAEARFTLRSQDVEKCGISEKAGYVKDKRQPKSYDFVPRSRQDNEAIKIAELLSRHLGCKPK